MGEREGSVRGLGYGSLDLEECVLTREQARIPLDIRKWSSLSTLHTHPNPSGLWLHGPCLGNSLVVWMR